MNTDAQILNVSDDAVDDWKPVRFDGYRFLARILRRWRLIAGTTLLFALLGLVYALTRKPFFEAKVSFLPPARDLTATSSLNPTSLFLPSTQAATYLGFLKSSTVLRDVARQQNLMQVYHAVDIDTAAAILGGDTFADATQDGIITVKARAFSPTLAAAIANAYLSAVHSLTRKMADESLRQRSTFYADQLTRSRKELEESERSLQANQERGGILDPTGATQIAIATQARLQAAAQAAQVQLTALLQSNTDASPAVIRARSEIAELRLQLAQQSSKTTNSARGVEAGGALPSLNIEAVRRAREVKEREVIYESLLRQTQQNHMGQEDPGPELQVIDMATVPKRKAGPGRIRYLVAGTAFGFFSSLAWAAMSTWIFAVARKMRLALGLAKSEHDS